MSQNTGIAPFNWPAFVIEAIHRRKSLNITQKEHAALAGVSIPTMISFEKAETTLSIGKALDILNVVGLVFHKEESSNDLSGFTARSERRWLTLIQNLPPNSPARHRYGYYHYTFIIEENLKNSGVASLDKLLGYLKQASGKKYSGWSPFWIPTREEIAPYIENAGIECWHNNSIFLDAAHSDFWRVELGDLPSTKLYMHIHRGYEEDSMEIVEPGTIFDLTFPIIRSGEIILHAARLARILTEHPENVKIKLHASYTGLEGRILSSMDGGMYEKKICNQRSVDLNIVINVSDVSELPEKEDKLAPIVHQFLAELYNRFGFFKLSEELVETKLNKMRAHRF